MIWPTDPPEHAPDPRDHGSRCGCDACEPEPWLLDAADAADRAREDAAEDARCDAGMLAGDIDW